MADEKYRHLFGPVESRRLGRSLGVDVVPLKICTFNCLYCQLGVTQEPTLERKEYVPVVEVLAELEKWLEEGGEADYLTFSGSGEPTLHSGLGRLLEAIKELKSKAKLAVITNGSLLFRSEVRDELAAADLVMPSLDAADAETYRKLNRPAEHVSFEQHLEGLRDFSLAFKGELWLEVLFVAGVNDSDEHVTKLAGLLETIRHDKLQLNTVSRPPTESVKRVSHERMEKIRKRLGDKAEVISGEEKERPYGAF